MSASLLSGVALVTCLVALVRAAPVQGVLDVAERRLIHNAFNATLEEECGPGYLCSSDGPYGCQRIGAPRGTPMVCCSTGQTVEDCDTSSSPIHPLPFCPFGGATGSGCIRGQEHGKHVITELSVVY